MIDWRREPVAIPLYTTGTSPVASCASYLMCKPMDATVCSTLRLAESHRIFKLHIHYTRKLNMIKYSLMQTASGGNNRIKDTDSSRTIFRPLELLKFYTNLTYGRVTRFFRRRRSHFSFSFVLFFFLLFRVE